MNVEDVKEVIQQLQTGVFSFIINPDGSESIETDDYVIKRNIREF